MAKRVEHNHIDSQRRESGTCPACDVAWDRQRERLKAKNAAATEVDNLYERHHRQIKKET